MKLNMYVFFLLLLGHRFVLYINLVLISYNVWGVLW